jgi:hypothetical protein
VSSVSNGLYFVTLPLVSVMRVIYTSKGMSKKFGVRVIHEVRVIYQKIRYFKFSQHTVLCNIMHYIYVYQFNPLNAKLNPIYHLLALLRAHPILHISRIRVKGFFTTFLYVHSQ